MNSTWQASVLVTVMAAGCTRHDIVDSFVSSAHRAPIVMPGALDIVGPEGQRYELLAGDMHCHVSPPDHPSDVDRGLDETIRLARTEGLDFVVLTPHVPARFYMDAAMREEVAESQRQLARDLARHPTGDIVFIPGFEYTDHRYGHVSASFADLDAVLADVSLETAGASPERFFERWVSGGGLLVVNHPLVTPIQSIIPMARADLSWRPLTSKGDVPPEIAAVDRLAHGYEVFNLAATELRDRVLLNRPLLTLERSLRAIDESVPRAKRRIAAVGGSDSHSHHLRAATFVLAEGRSRTAIRDAIAGGRTCVRDPAACTFEVHDGLRWLPVGTALGARKSVEVRARGGSIEIFSNGRVVATPESNAPTRIDTSGDSCVVVRARVDEGWSAPVYVGCDV